MSRNTVAVAFAGATKEWRRRGRVVRALDGLTWASPGPGVHGLIGPNGAGKTTAMRAVVGHQFLTSGRATLLGAGSRSELHDALQRTGVMIETPRFHPHLTGERTLEILATIGGIPRVRVDSVLEQVGLAARSGDRVGGYSLGMRQRLGLAVALLKDPEVLVLDEPANGLDPSGIRDLRGLLRRCGDEGRTVVVSSHLLGELAQICDTCTVMVSGSLRWSGALRDLDVGTRYAVGVHGDLPTAAELVARAGWETVVDHGRLVVAVEPDSVWKVSQLLAVNGLHVVELKALEGDLEALYSSMTGDAGAQDAFGEVGV